MSKQKCNEESVREWCKQNGYLLIRESVYEQEITKAYFEGQNAPQPKIGKWLAVENEDMETVGYYCSECDLPLETEERTPFCPCCGAKMAESGEKK